MRRYYYKKFWEEIVAYFIFIPYGPHRKRKKLGDTQTDTHTEKGDLISPILFYFLN
jgi:hypothetical protein